MRQKALEKLGETNKRKREKEGRDGKPKKKKLKWYHWVPQGKEWTGDEIKAKTVGVRKKSAGGRETEKWCILQCYASATATTVTNTVYDDAFTTKPSYN